MKNKINQTAYNFFLCLLFIIRKREFSIEEILLFLEQEHQILLFSETILKYIRTMKMLGFVFKKNNKTIYQLISIPFKIINDEFDFDILVKSILLSRHYYSKGSRNEKYVLLEKLKLFLPNYAKEKLLQIFGEENNIVSFNIKQYCIDAQRLNITYIKDGTDEVTQLIEPYEIVTISKKVFLRGFNLSEKTNVLLDAIFIKNIVQTPIKNKYKKIPQSAVLSFYGKFANTYSLKENEKIIKKESGSLRVECFYEDKELLFRNIFRYMQNCEIIEPESLRNDFKKYLNDLYQIYDCRVLK